MYPIDLGMDPEVSQEFDSSVLGSLKHVLGVEAGHVRVVEEVVDR